MRREQLPITSLPAWSKLNDVSFLDIHVRDLGESKGSGLVTERNLSSKDTFDLPNLLLLPRDLILSMDFIESHGKVDQHLRQLLDAAGGKSLRGDILLFLLMQITIGLPNHDPNVGLSTAWTAYTKMLPSSVPVPTIWSEEERMMLLGTSLEEAVNAKMSTLLREFEALREQTQIIPWAQKYWWDDENLNFEDWVLIDAWWRSRCLEIPNLGECMVPCLDLVNHSRTPNAYYELGKNMSLLLRSEMTLDIGSEITIDYGSTKSEAEMLFTYGFIDEQTQTRSMALTLEPFSDDPLGRAKSAAFSGPHIVQISIEGAAIQWKSPFLYFMVLNEEDGLAFRVLQQIDGSRSRLRVFWQESDVTEATGEFESLVENHPLNNIFKLRAIVMLEDRIREQLGRLQSSEGAVKFVASIVTVGSDRINNAIQLRNSENLILESALRAITLQKDKLLEDDVVVQYLNAPGELPKETHDEEEGPTQTLNDDIQDDFS